MMMKWLLCLVVCFVVGRATSVTHSFRLGCFNIENLGPTKASRSSVVDVLSSVMKRYDLLFIQELSDKPPQSGVCGNLTGNVICKFLSLLPSRKLAVSRRLSASGSGEEQYVLLYNPEQFDLLASWVVNKSVNGNVEPAYDRFMRPPMITTLRSRVTHQVIAAGVCHTKPENALEEVLGLAAELVELEKRHSALSFICGDFNTKFSKANWQKYYAALPDNGTHYGMEIRDGVATGVLSGATLDRIITTPAMHKLVSGADAFWFNDTSKGGFSMDPVVDQGCGTFVTPCDSYRATAAVSDHFPVEMTVVLSSTTLTAPALGWQCWTVGLVALHIVMRCPQRRRQ